MIRLVDKEGRKYFISPLLGYYFTLGTSGDCDKIISTSEGNPEGVDKKHARIILYDNGSEVKIRDLNSEKGTYVGNKKLEPKEECSIEGKKVFLGDLELKLVRDF